jgi:hypothetical protein
MAKRKGAKGKQQSTKHYTEKKRLINIVRTVRTAAYVS